MNKPSEQVDFRFLIGSQGAADHQDDDWEALSPEAIKSQVGVVLTDTPEPPHLLLAGHGPAPTRTVIGMPDGAGNAWFESLELMAGMTVGRAVYDFRPSTEPLSLMSTMVGRSARPMLFVQAVRSGQASVHDRRRDRRVMLAPDQCYVQLTDRVDQSNRTDAVGILHATGLAIEERLLPDLLGESLANALLDTLGGGHGAASGVQLLPPELLSILHACLPARMGGPLKTLYTQAKALEFMAGMAEHFTGAPRLKPCKHGVIQAIKHELDTLDGNLPNPAELASRYGLSQRLIGETFRQTYGQSLFSYIRNRRLDAALLALSQGHFQIKTIAHQLGFPSVQHFSHAFARRFGYPPGRVLRKTVTVESGET